MKAFLKGFASAFDFSGRHLADIQSAPGGFERDRMMLQGDWIRVGSDIRSAMNAAACDLPSAEGAAAGARPRLLACAPAPNALN